MEQSLGKRIIENRKRLGLTQDRLAEQLGVTAQAVSKWENNQSCPDITLLPKLAEIFEVSTDALLGIEKIREAEVIDEKPDAGIQVGHNGNHWEFNYDGDRKTKLAVAIWLLLVGGLILASIVLHSPVNFWHVAWPSAILLFGLFGLFPRFSFFRLGCALLGGYNLLNIMHILPHRLEKQMLLPFFLLLLGCSALVDAVKTKKDTGFTITRDGKTVHSNIKQLTADYSEEGDSFDYGLAFGSDTRHITLPRVAEGNIEIAFGELTVDLTSVTEFSENCHLDIDCSFGQLMIRLPKNCRVIPSADTNLASVKFCENPDPQPRFTLLLECDVTFGEVQICYE